MDATTIVDVITGADAAATVDAATAVAAEPVFLAAVPPAAAFSGSSFLCAAAEITDMAIATVDAEMVITAGSSSFCCFSAADVATTMAAVVDAVADAATTVDADSVPVRAYQAKKAEDHFLCLCLSFSAFRSFSLCSFFCLFFRHSMSSS